MSTLCPLPTQEQETRPGDQGLVEPPWRVKVDILEADCVPEFLLFNRGRKTAVHAVQFFAVDEKRQALFPHIMDHRGLAPHN